MVCLSANVPLTLKTIRQFYLLETLRCSADHRLIFVICNSRIPVDIKNLHVCVVYAVV